MMIEVNSVTKTYGSRKAVDNISFTVDSGEIVGFLGPNGAGKTSTMKMITGYMPPTSGSIKIAGFDIIDDSIKAKRHIGYLPEMPPLYLDMTVEAYLAFVSELKEVPRQSRKSIIDKVISEVGLKEVRNRLIKNLSKGFKQRVGLAQAIIGDPDVLILDEPTVGLDPKQIKEIREIIKKLGEKRTIILSTHILPEVSMICDRVIIINNGKIVAMDNTENLSGSLDKSKRYFLKVIGPIENIKPILVNLNGITDIKISPDKDKECVNIIVETVVDKDLRKDIFFLFAKNNIPIIEFRPVKHSLEDIFLKLTTEEEGFNNENHDNIQKRA